MEMCSDERNLLIMEMCYDELEMMDFEHFSVYDRLTMEKSTRIEIMAGRLWEEAKRSWIIGYAECWTIDVVTTSSPSSRPSPYFGRAAGTRITGS